MVKPVKRTVVQAPVPSITDQTPVLQSQTKAGYQAYSKLVTDLSDYIYMIQVRIQIELTFTLWAIVK